MVTLPLVPVSKTEDPLMESGAMVMMCVFSDGVLLIWPTVTVPMPLLFNPTVALSKVRERTPSGILMATSGKAMREIMKPSG